MIRWRVRAFVIRIGGVLGLLLLGVPTLLPASLGTEIARGALVELGLQDARIGTAGLQLWPLPEVVVTDVQIGPLAGEEALPSLSGHIVAIRMRLDLLALIRGKLVARTVHLQQPELVFAHIPDMHVSRNLVVTLAEARLTVLGVPIFSGSAEFLLRSEAEGEGWRLTAWTAQSGRIELAAGPAQADMRPLRLTLEADDGQVVFTGDSRAVSSSKDSSERSTPSAALTSPHLIGRLTAAIPDCETFAEAFGVRHVPLVDLDFAANVTWAPGHLMVASVSTDGRADDSEGDGSQGVNAIDLGGRWRISGSFPLGRIDVGRALDWLDNLWQEPPAADFALRIPVDGFRWGELSAGISLMTLTADHQAISLALAETAALDGTVMLAGHLFPATGAFDLEMRMNAIALEPLLRKLTGRPLAAGALTGTIGLSGRRQATDPAVVLTGSGQVTVTDGRIGAGVASLARPLSFNSLGISARLADGMVSFDQVRIQALPRQLTGSGTVALSDGKVDIALVDTMKASLAVVDGGGIRIGGCCGLWVISGDITSVTGQSSVVLPEPIPTAGEVGRAFLPP